MDEYAWRLVRLFGPMVLLGPFVALYVHRDLRRRDEAYPLPRAIGFGCLGLLGLFAYLYLHGNLMPEE